MKYRGTLGSQRCSLTILASVAVPVGTLDRPRGRARHGPAPHRRHRQLLPRWGPALLPAVNYYDATKFAVRGTAARGRAAGHQGPAGVPGPSYTNWVGRYSSETQSGHVIADYDDTAGVARASFRTSTSGEPSATARAAQAIITAVQVDNPQRRLLLGSLAYDLALQSSTSRGTSSQGRTSPAAPTFPQTPRKRVPTENPTEVRLDKRGALSRSHRQPGSDTRTRLRRPATRSREFVRSTCVHSVGAAACDQGHSAYLPDHGVV